MEISWYPLSLPMCYVFLHACVCVLFHLLHSLGSGDGGDGATATTTTLFVRWTKSTVYFLENSLVEGCSTSLSGNATNLTLLPCSEKEIARAGT